MSIRPDAPETSAPVGVPRLETEWRRQEAARGAVASNASAALGYASEDRLYSALARAAAMPAPAIPAGFAERLQRRAHRADIGDRFEIALMAGVLVIGGVLALFYGLPALAGLAQSSDLRLPEISSAGLHWALMGAATLALSGLLNGLLERRKDGHR